ncbi:endonuclease/exonuclease/phosphatase family protein [Phenylobacterium sp. LjRoot225]|uniref:endonuclease/exonuclease/phosphatase family protein n=1 Tax=Phenylobacterium sp. LjRoot225 TaxID=3342285 RepID=UPI003ECFAA92
MRALRLALNLLLWSPVFLMAALCALAGIAAQWGRVSLQWDVAAQFAPIWLAGSALCLVASTVFRRGLRWSLAAVSLVGFAAAATLIVPEFLRPTGPHAAADARDTLKIVQFNVWHENPDPKAVLDWLDAERPDIVVIEENSWRFAQAAAARSRGWSVACARCEVMMLSRRPALHVEKGRRAPNAPPTPLTRAVFRDRHGVFEVIGVHNAWPTDADQPFQERRLAALIASRPRERLIVTGDFNSTPWSFQRRRWDAAFGLTRRDRAIASWPARNYGRLRWLGLPFLPIDHVYAGPGWATVSVRRGPRLSSDHYPIVLTLAPVAPR